MATLSLSPSCLTKHTSPVPFIITPTRMITIVCCQNRHPDDAKMDKGAKGVMLHKVWIGVEKLGKGVQDNLSPKQKGDWKDLTLMSLSFAVYVYMSQKIVCAYCLWMSTARQPW